MKDFAEKIHNQLSGGDILFVVPPFTTNSPAIGPHILQAVARENGYRADILYLNLLLAAELGLEFSEKIGTSELFQYWSMLNERLFARAAYELPPLGIDPWACTDEAVSVSGGAVGHRTMDFDKPEAVDLEHYYEIEERCFQFVDSAAECLASSAYQVIGCTARMGQVNCGTALLKRVKILNPDVITIMGGASCQDEMGAGIASLSPYIDHVFSGESEAALIEFLKKCFNGDAQPRIISGSLVQDLDSLPMMDYHCYFEQFKAFGHTVAPAYVWSETSRGCWWGQKNKCTFCSRNNSSLSFRAKSPQRVLKELSFIKSEYPGVQVAMADNIMPFSYTKDLLPVMAKSELYPEICLYYVKANLSLNDLVNLKNAGVAKVIPGIESLSTELLNLLNKGVKASDNISLLRNAASVGMNFLWFMLWAVPGDREKYYEEMLALMPLIRHFQPPAKFFRVHLERFSNYTQEPEVYRITNLRPWAVYKMIYPEWADISKLAFGFTGDYPCEAYDRPDLLKQLTAELEIWRSSWKRTQLVLFPFTEELYVLHDSRNLAGTVSSHMLDGGQAASIMSCGDFLDNKDRQWALENKLAVILDDRYVPLITAAPQLLVKFEQEKR